MTVCDSPTECMFWYTCLKSVLEIGKGSMLTSGGPWESGPEVLCPILTVALHTTGP